MEPGYDVVVQAASGIIAATGYPGQPPCKPGPSIADMTFGTATPSSRSKTATT